MSIENLKKILESERDELAEQHTNTTYFHLEYSTFGTTAKECQKSYKSGHESATNRFLPLLQKAVEMATYYATDLPYKESIQTMNYCGDDCPVSCNEHSFDHKVKTRAAAHSKQIAREFLSDFTKMTEIKKESV